MIGLEGVRQARALRQTGWRLGLRRTRRVIDAGRFGAVISALLVEGETVEKVVGDFLEFLR